MEAKGKGEKEKRAVEKAAEIALGRPTALV
jgi:hypothetical protein